jgi:hypothetical protein
MQDEIYADILECPGYQVSNYGNVLKLNKAGVYEPVSIYYLHGRPQFSLSGVTTFVHRMVAKYFVSNPKNRPHVDHIDRNILNNQCTNLRWVTPAENYANRSGNCNGKLDWETANKIRIDYATVTYSMCKLAEKYKCNKSNVHSIVHNLYWRDEDYGLNGRYA